MRNTDTLRALLIAAFLLAPARDAVDSLMARGWFIDLLRDNFDFSPNVTYALNSLLCFLYGPGQCLGLALAAAAVFARGHRVALLRAAVISHVTVVVTAICADFALRTVNDIPFNYKFAVLHASKQLAAATAILIVGYKARLWSLHRSRVAYEVGTPESRRIGTAALLGMLSYWILITETVMFPRILAVVLRIVMSWTAAPAFDRATAVICLAQWSYIAIIGFSAVVSMGSLRRFRLSIIRIIVSTVALCVVRLACEISYPRDDLWLYVRMAVWEWWWTGPVVLVLAWFYYPLIVRSGSWEEAAITECEYCGYDLRGSPGLACPECGR